MIATRYRGPDGPRWALRFMLCRNLAMRQLRKSYCILQLARVFRVRRPSKANYTMQKEEEDALELEEDIERGAANERPPQACTGSCQCPPVPLRKFVAAAGTRAACVHLDPRD